MTELVSTDAVSSSARLNGIEGFWLEGQVFESQALHHLWLHWHLQAADGDWEYALRQGRVVLDQCPQTLADAETVLIPGQRYALFKPEHEEGPANADWKILWQNHELLGFFSNLSNQK